MDELKERAFGVAALETLALMAEHRLSVVPLEDDDGHPDGWMAERMHDPGSHGGVWFSADGPTIGDAVRACVARIEEGK